MIALITGWKWRWPNITAPSMTSSLSSLASDSTISTASAVALEVAAGNAACSVGLLLVVDGQRQEIHAFARRLRRNDGGEHHGLAVGRDHGAIGLSRHLSGFKLEGTSTPVDFHGMLIEHIGLLSWVHERAARPETKRPCARWRDADRNADQ